MYDDIDLHLVYPCLQAWRVVKAVISVYDRPVVVCQDHIWFGAGFGRAVAMLVRELNDQFPSWGACGNRGISWEGSKVYDYTAYTQGGSAIHTSISARPVLTLDDNLVLINSKVFRNCELVDLGAIESLIFGIPLSLECLRYHLPLLTSPHLFTIRKVQHTPAQVATITACPEFQSYYSRHFINHSVPWPDSTLDLQDAVDYEYAVRPDRKAVQSDVMSLFDAALMEGGNRRPSLTICCRTQFARPELLHRAITSFAIAQAETNGLLSLNVRLMSDSDPAASDAFLQGCRDEFPGLRVECWFHTIRTPRHSRTDLLITAIERATTDYIWFVDDDDFILPGAVEALSRTLVSDDPIITVANSVKVQETWSTLDTGSQRTRFLETSHVFGRFQATDIFRVFRGMNFTPVCSMILPVALAAKRLKDRHALGDYGEDYFVLLTVITSPQVEIRTLNVDVCGVSFRGQENTVSERDPSRWHFSYSTFMREVLAAGDQNPVLWQLGNSGLS